MKRQQIAAGNWKMNTTLQEAQELFLAISSQYDLLPLSEHHQVILAPPYIYLEQLSGRAEEYPYLYIAAQNCHQEDKGAYTGEISAQMLATVGVSHVIIGHSERRMYFNESHDLLSKKVLAAIHYNLKPIFCCGEPLNIREAGTHFEHVQIQLEESLWTLSSEDFSTLVIAYEPVWAIGTGRTASPEQAQEMHAFIRQLISSKYGAEIADMTPILYGGSCNAANAPELFMQHDVDGGLVGGASLKASEFIKIIQSLQ